MFFALTVVLALTVMGTAQVSAVPDLTLTPESSAGPVFVQADEGQDTKEMTTGETIVHLPTLLIPFYGVLLDWPELTTTERVVDIVFDLISVLLVVWFCRWAKRRGKTADDSSE